MGVGETGQIIGETGVGETGVGEMGVIQLDMVIAYFLILTTDKFSPPFISHCT